MKLVDEKGRLFGLVNVVDLFAVIIVLCVVGGIGWKLLGPRVVESVSPQVTMTTIIRIRGASEAMVAEVTHQEGKLLVSGNDYVPDTNVESIVIEPYVIQAQTANGEIVDATDPTKKDIVVTLTSKVAKDTPVPKIGNQEVRTGRTLTFKTNDFETIGNIESVKFA